jgi:drug/metabolite transporter (DMT)-like permease
MTPTARRAELALVVVTLCWGLTFPLIKVALEYCAPMTFMALRFPLAFLLLLPFLRGRPFPSRQVLGVGTVLGVLLGISLSAQVMGLVHTTPTRSAFITGLSVILVPMLYPLITRRRPGLWPTVGAVLAAVGLYFLTDPGAGGLNRGDGITLFCALGYALYIIALEEATRRHAFEDVLLVQMVVLSLLFAGPAIAEGGPRTLGPGLWIGVGGTALILAVTMYLQNRYQRWTTAPRAAVIFAAEPMFAAVFSFLIFAEVLAPVQWGGGSLILLGILAAEKR